MSKIKVKKETRTVYITTDGETFFNKEDAEIQQKAIDLDENKQKISKYLWEALGLNPKYYYDGEADVDTVLYGIEGDENPTKAAKETAEKLEKILGGKYSEWANWYDFFEAMYDIFGTNHAQSEKILNVFKKYV
ncbi:MAG: hypothetical protein WC401_10870 [Bacteroidales bacterium]|jgi:hypothetical protein